MMGYPGMVRMLPEDYFILWRRILSGCPVASARIGTMEAQAQLPLDHSPAIDFLLDERKKGLV